MKKRSGTEEGRKAFSSALLLVRHEDHAVVERQSLRRAGIRQVRVLTSGVDAALLLSGKQKTSVNPAFPDVVICDEQLSDMTGYEFLAFIRSHPGLACFPVVLALTKVTPAATKRAEELACSGLLQRPYSGQDFLAQLARAHAMHGSGVPVQHDVSDLSVFDALLAQHASTRKASSEAAAKWYREGLLCLKQKRWEPAAFAFQQALREQGDHTDAARGLSEALRRQPTEAAHPSLEGDPASAESAALLSHDEKIESGEHTAQRLAPLPDISKSENSAVLRHFPVLRDAVNVARITLGLYKGRKK